MFSQWFNLPIKSLCLWLCTDITSLRLKSGVFHRDKFSYLVNIQGRVFFEKSKFPNQIKTKLTYISQYARININTLFSSTIQYYLTVISAFQNVRPSSTLLHSNTYWEARITCTFIFRDFCISQGAYLQNLILQPIIKIIIYHHYYYLFILVRSIHHVKILKYLETKSILWVNYWKYNYD